MEPQSNAGQHCSWIRGEGGGLPGASPGQSNKGQKEGGKERGKNGGMDREKEEVVAVKLDSTTTNRKYIKWLIWIIKTCPHCDKTRQDAASELLYLLFPLPECSSPT